MIPLVVIWVGLSVSSSSWPTAIVMGIIIACEVGRVVADRRFIETLAVGLNDPRHRAIEALHHRKPEGVHERR
jgi:hypothetical protein